MFAVNFADKPTQSCTIEVRKKTLEGVIYMLFIMGIVAISMTVPVTRLITDHLQKMSKIKGELVREEIELEQLKQQNYIIETEKMKLELEKMRIEYTPAQEDLMKV